MFETSIVSQTQNDFANSGTTLFFNLLITFTVSSCTGSDNICNSFSLLLAEEQDDFYEFTPEDYYRILATKKQGTAYYEFMTIFVYVRMCNDFIDD